MTPIRLFSETRESIETSIFGLTFRTLVGIKRPLADPYVEQRACGRGATVRQGHPSTT